jgi:hypothetical protein
MRSEHRQGEMLRGERQCAYQRRRLSVSAMGSPLHLRARIGCAMLYVPNATLTPWPFQDWSFRCILGAVNSRVASGIRLSGVQRPAIPHRNPTNVGNELHWANACVRPRKEDMQCGITTPFYQPELSLCNGRFRRVARSLRWSQPRTCGCAAQPLMRVESNVTPGDGEPTEVCARHCILAGSLEVIMFQASVAKTWTSSGAAERIC